MEWGNEIAVNGVRPDWLRDGEPMQYQTSARSTFHDMSWGWGWGVVGGAIRLPADHAYYLVARYNEQYGTSFVYWPGGDAAPADWDGGDVLRRDGFPEKVERRSARAPIPWAHYPTIGNHERYDVIGYTRRSEPTRDTVAVERMDQAAAKALVHRYTNPDGDRWKALTTHRDDMIRLLDDLGLIRPELTEAERIAAETGVPVETVQRVLDARS